MGILRAATALVAILLSGWLDAQATTLRIHGSNTIGERLAPALIDAWLRHEGHAVVDRASPAPQETTLRARGDGGGDIEVQLRAHGSGTGFADLLAGRADIAMASRSVSAIEVEKGAALGRLDSAAQEAVLALDGVAVIVHPQNPLRSISLEQLRAVFGGSVRDWARLGRRPGQIRVLARDENSGTWETFRALVLGGLPLRADARRIESTTQLARIVASDPDAIGFVGLAGIGDARAVPVAEAGHALAPVPFTVAVEDYALSRRLYLYHGSEVSPATRRFIEFALSAEGQRVVESVGFVAQQVRAYRTDVRGDAPEEYRDLVRDAERLSVNFRFSAGDSLLDGKALRDIDRLADFMRRPENRERSLMLLGFADASEAGAYHALTLSNDRVDFIAQRLQSVGLAPSRLRGMGGSAPIASNDNPTGRYRNRRVEVWLGAPAARASVAAGGGRR